MTEKGVAEAYIYEQLKGIATIYGLEIQKLPIKLADTGQKVPVLYFGFVTGKDVGTLGPGPRTHAKLTYEIGVFYPGVTLGASFVTTTGTWTVVAIASKLDEVFQDYSTLEVIQGGMMLSCERTQPLEITEDGEDKTVYKREGGLYDIYAKKSSWI